MVIAGLRTVKFRFSRILSNYGTLHQHRGVGKIPKLSNVKEATFISTILLDRRDSVENSYFPKGKRKHSQTADISSGNALPGFISDL